MIRLRADRLLFLTSLFMQSTFYEGVTTTGYATNPVDNATQRTIVAAISQPASMLSGPPYIVGSACIFKATTPGYSDHYLAHNGATVNTQVIISSSSSAAQNAAKLFHPSLQPCSAAQRQQQQQAICPGRQFMHTVWPYWLRHQQHPFVVLPCSFWRHYFNVGYPASNGGVDSFDVPASDNNDVSCRSETSEGTIWSRSPHDSSTSQVLPHPPVCDRESRLSFTRMGSSTSLSCPRSTSDHSFSHLAFRFLESLLVWKHGDSLCPGARVTIMLLRMNAVFSRLLHRFCATQSGFSQENVKRRFVGHIWAIESARS
ncbi:non-reducing end alpha-L-arabinofuranosidase [Sarracenia purpurea var. burkii]